MNQEALLEKHYLCIVLHSPNTGAQNVRDGSKKKHASQSANNFYLMSISYNDNDSGSSGAFGNLSKKLGTQPNKQAQLIKIKEKIDF